MSTNDRELLEMAAKAVGLDYHIDHCDGCPKIIANGDVWNPFVFDAQALRLAVKLGLDIMRTERDVEAIATLPPHAKITWGTVGAPFAIELLGDKPEAATRRAIVRAAAEIGMAMP